MELGFSTINPSDEKRGLKPPATRIQRPTDGAHWSAPNHLFCEATVTGMSATKMDRNYNYKTELQIWK